MALLGATVKDTLSVQALQVAVILEEPAGHAVRNSPAAQLAVQGRQTELRPVPLLKVP